METTAYGSRLELQEQESGQAKIKNWYKGKPEVEPPSSSLQEERGAKFSIHKEVPGQVQVPTDEDGTERSGQQELGN